MNKFNSILLIVIACLIVAEIDQISNETIRQKLTREDSKANLINEEDDFTNSSEYIEIEGRKIPKSDIEQINFGEYFTNLTKPNIEINYSLIHSEFGNESELETPDAAREKLMKVNPNLVNFIEKVMKIREQNSGYVSDFFANTWKVYEENETEDDLSDICLFSPNGACHVHVSNKCKVVTYESLFNPKLSQNNSCRLHEKYIYHRNTNQGINFATGLTKMPTFNQFNHTSMRVRYKCDLNTNIFPANQSGIVKSLTPEQFVKLINGSRSCILAMFYSPYCVFSVKFAPHVNALARNFPAIHVVAVNALLNKQ